jgi:hypothetical protein
LTSGGCEWLELIILNKLVIRRFTLINQKLEKNDSLKKMKTGHGLMRMARFIFFT